MLCVIKFLWNYLSGSNSNEVELGGKMGGFVNMDPHYLNKLAVTEWGTDGPFCNSDWCIVLTCVWDNFSVSLECKVFVQGQGGSQSNWRAASGQRKHRKPAPLKSFWLAVVWDNLTGGACWLADPLVPVGRETSVRRQGSGFLEKQLGSCWWGWHLTVPHRLRKRELAGRN